MGIILLRKVYVMNITVMIADDDNRIRRVISDFMKRDGFKVIEAENGEQAIEIFDQQKDTIDLVILDVMMPITDGWGVLRHIRNISRDTLVMMLTAKTEDGEQIYGFETGADDYVTKPISPVVLMLRIKALIKRSIDKSLSYINDYNGLVIDQSAHSIKIDGREINLSPKEYDLLIYLTSNNSMALSREQIVNAVWGYDYFGDMRTLDTHIKNIRAKLGDKGEYIKTVRGYGYKFEV